MSNESSEQRLDHVTIAEDKDLISLAPGEMTSAPSRYSWFICCPQCKGCGNLGGHTIQKHEDGTLTVSPSILCGCGAHYFVERNRIRWV